MKYILITLVVIAVCAQVIAQRPVTIHCSNLAKNTVTSGSEVTDRFGQNGSGMHAYYFSKHLLKLRRYIFNGLYQGQRICLRLYHYVSPLGVTIEKPLHR